MSKKYKFEIVTPERIFYSDEVDMVIFDSNEEQDEDLVIYIPSNTLDPEKALLKEEEKKEFNNMLNENLSKKEKKVFFVPL